MRIQPRGATLIEVMVVGSIFFVMLTAIVAIYMSTVRAERVISVKSEVDRTVVAAVRHVDAAVKSAQLIKPDDYADDPQFTDSIELRALKSLPDGTPSVTAEGLPEWEAPYTIAFESGQLVRINPERRVFATLGGEGFVRFRRPTKEMLEMEVRVEKEGEREYKTARQAIFQFRLFNQ